MRVGTLCLCSQRASRWGRDTRALTAVLPKLLPRGNLMRWSALFPCDRPRGLRVRLLIATALIAVVAAAFVMGASARDSTISPGVAIGKVRLDMTFAEVESVLGKDFLVNERRSAYLEIGWNFGSWTVSFKKKSKAYRAVQVAVTLRSQRTLKGIGPGVTWRVLVRAYPYGLCTHKIDLKRMQSTVEYLVPHTGGTQTIFFLPQPLPPSGANDLAPWRVNQVWVRTPFERLPEFAPHYAYACRPGWENRDSP